jgi:hypothetical protein
MRDCVEEEEDELKKTGIDIFQGLLEGQGGKKTVYERVLSVIHLDVIEMMCAPIDEKEDKEDEEKEKEIGGGEGGVSGAATVLRTECLVLLQMLCDYRPSLRAELQLSLGRSSAGEGGKGAAVVSVEILWRGELQRRFFSVPAICSDLAKASKDALVEDVNRSNLEIKLQDFVFRCYDMFREIEHQQVLKDWYVSGVFSRSNQNLATWISFSLACLINMLLLCFYTTDSGELMLKQEVRYATNALNICQLASASFTLILFLVVRVPVKYQQNVAAGYSPMMTLIHTSTDALTMYYFVYLIICLFAFNYSDTFLPILLLDIIVKNSTARDVLNAIVYPRKQLAMTLLLGIFVTYIFSFVIVSFTVSRITE